MENINYRKKFKDHYGIEFGEDFDIHHIDFDRVNNEIENLILLPKLLHQKLHSLALFSGLTIDLFNFKGLAKESPVYYKAEIIAVIELWEKLQIWSAKKECEDNGTLVFNYNEFRRLKA
jgi:hypothetical protein